jgi:hypothetical protein
VATEWHLGVSRAPRRAYGVALIDWPLIASSVITLALMLVTVALKLRHG